MAAIDFPTSPTNGQTFTSGDKTWVYSTTVGAWNLQTQTLVGPTGPTGATGPVGYAFYYSATAPLSPVDGDRWLDTNAGIEYTYFNDGNSSQWVETHASGYFGPAGPTGPTGATGPAGPNDILASLQTAAIIIMDIGA